MSVGQGWAGIPPEHGGRAPAAGDLILLEVRKPRQVTAAPDWMDLGEFIWTDDEGREHTGHAFCKIIGPREINPLFTTTEPSPEGNTRPRPYRLRPGRRRGARHRRAGILPCVARPPGLRRPVTRTAALPPRRPPPRPPPPSAG